MTLQQNDLVDLVSEVIEIDSDKSKMGSDADIITITFSTISRESAQDLTNFFERGYTFVLDADATSSEQTDGTYKVFVELERDRNICLLYTSPSPRDATLSRMPSSA